MDLIQYLSIVHCIYVCGLFPLGGSLGLYRYKLLRNVAIPTFILLLCSVWTVNYILVNCEACEHIVSASQFSASLKKDIIKQIIINIYLLHAHKVGGRGEETDK